MFICGDIINQTTDEQFIDQPLYNILINVTIPFVILKDHVFLVA